MPTYDFRCEKCKKSFSLTISISQWERKRIKCPKCGSTRTKQLIGNFFAMTSKKG